MPFVCKNLTTIKSAFPEKVFFALKIIKFDF